MPLIDFWMLLTFGGDIRFWIIALLFLAVYTMRLMSEEDKARNKFRRFLGLMLLALVIVSLTTQGLKIYFNQPRICTPCNGIAEACNPYCPLEDSYAFPSGHAALSFGMFTAGWLFARSRKWLWIFIIPLLIAISRVLLGVHMPLDVVVGSAWGIAMGALCWYVAGKRL